MNDSSQSSREAAMDAPTSIRLRLARPTDAPYLFKLRVDPALNEHLSPPPPSVDAQSSYLTKYLERERNGIEFYFVIQNRATGNDCGAVRIYDLQPRSFSWGSWILDAGKPRLAALESALFVYDFGFGHLGFPASHFEVRRGNDRVIAFHERLGARRLREDDKEVFLSLSRKDLQSRLPTLLSLTSYAPVFLDKRSGAASSRLAGGTE
jgi:RimJ/RimL family protein N-acetyltransferase